MLGGADNEWGGAWKVLGGVQPPALSPKIHPCFEASMKKQTFDREVPAGREEQIK